MPRFLPLLLAVLAVLYGGYWFFGRSGIEQATREALNRPGIGYDSLNTIGFPSRFDTTIEGVDLVAANGRIGWQAPFFQLFMLSYAPHRVIAVWPDRQSLRIGDTIIEVTSGQMRASVQVGVSPSVPLRNATFEAEGVQLAGPDGRSVAISRTLLAIREAGGDAPGHRYDIFGDVTGLTADPPPDYSVDPAAIRIDGVMTLDQPIDRYLTQIGPQRIELRDATIRWAGLTLTGPGEIDLVDGRLVSGRADLDVSDADRLIAILQSLGLLGPERAEILSGALAPATGPDGSVILPIAFSNGEVRIAGLPIVLR